MSIPIDKMLPEYSKEEFLKAVWETLVKEDVPEEVFKNDFSDIFVVEHQVYLEDTCADLSYVADIGYYREEPYIDYETYTEQEPYIGYEKYFDKNLGYTTERQVTKYRDVKKQRQVTRYKRVTDWSSISGNLSSASTATVDNTNLDLNEDVFWDCYRSVKDKGLVRLDENEIEQYQVTSETIERANSIHEDNYYTDVYRHLPGDKRSAMLNSVKVTEKKSNLILIQEYEASIVFNGEVYWKRAYPYGELEMMGDIIPNNISLASVKENKTYQLNQFIEKNSVELEKTRTALENGISKGVWKKTKGISIITIIALLASIAVSMLVPYVIPVIGAFALSIIPFVLFWRSVSKTTKKEKERTAKEIDDEEKRVENIISCEKEKVQHEIANFSSAYKQKRLRLLEEKLEALGINNKT